MNVSQTRTTNTSAPLTEIFSHLGRPCTVPLIFALGERSYSTEISELRSTISTNGKKISENAITKCLTGLTEIGIVEGTVHANPPSRAEYHLTSKGQHLYRHLLQLRLVAERTPSEFDLIESISAC